MAKLGAELAKKTNSKSRAKNLDLVGKSLT